VETIDKEVGCARIYVNRFAFQVANGAGLLGANLIPCAAPTSVIRVPG
jgi:hypothetical protein